MSLQLYPKSALTGLSAFVHDEETKRRLEAREEMEAKEQKLRDWVKDQIDRNVLLEEDNLLLTDWDHQIGKGLWPRELEVRLQKLAPYLHFEVNPFNRRMKALYIVHPDGRKEYILAYHNEFMPEYSIMRGKYENVVDLNTLKRNPDGSLHIDRKDLPASRPAPVTVNGESVPGFHGHQWDENVARPGWKRVFKCYGESKRGWRTVVARLVGMRLFTPEQAESIFGGSERRDWNAHVGGKAEIRW